jgi:hypothetical protein
MVENQDHFKFFIEDDLTFEDYIKDMKKDGTWGGNLEIYALSMKFNVNFYIQIYNHPMYIVKNFPVPLRNVHLSYHDGEHYNSVRLSDDCADDLPIYIPLELINCVEQTTNTNALNDKKIIADEDDESDDNNIEEEDENKLFKAQSEVLSTSNEKFCLGEEEISIGNTKIKDIHSTNKPKNEKSKKSILTQNRIIMDDVKDFSKCHCGGNKKYKNCCVNNDISGDYFKNSNLFYCDMNEFKSKFKYEKIKHNSHSNKNNDTNTITKQMERIFI